MNKVQFSGSWPSYSNNLTANKYHSLKRNSSQELWTDHIKMLHAQLKTFLQDNYYKSNVPKIIKSC